jgi:hypothetical protein
MKASEFAQVIKGCKNVDQWEEIIHHMEFDPYDDNEANAHDDLVTELKEKGYLLNSEDHYGGEGKGDQYWNVFSVEHNGEKTYFRIDGWYASYDGSHFDDCYEFYEVEKVPVQVFKWHAKKQ